MARPNCICDTAPTIDLLFLSVVCFATGLGLANTTATAIPFSLAGPAIAIISAALLAALRHRRNILTIILLGALFVFAGSIYGGTGPLPPASSNHIANHVADKKEAGIIGILTRMPVRRGETSTLILQTEHFLDPQKSSPATGLVRLTMQGKPSPDLVPGDRLVARGTFSRIRPPTSPGAFDFRAHLARQAIWVKGWIAAPVFLEKIHGQSSFFQEIRFLPERIRYRLSTFLDENMAPATRGVYKAILLGEKSEIPAALLENYKSAGVMHLLAISGLHMGLLAFCCIGGFTWLLKRSPKLLLTVPIRKVAALASLPLLAGYALIAGFHTPVIRALIMVSVFVVALLADRQWAVRTNIAIAALLILLASPHDLLSVSFQLSFAAVLCLGFFAPLLLAAHFREKPTAEPMPHRKIFQWLRTALLVSLVAMAGTLPLLLFHFNRFSPIAPLATLLVEPFLCIWSLLFGLAACLTLPCLPGLATLLLQAGSMGITIANFISEFLAGLPFSSIWLPTPNGWEISFYYLGLGSLLFWKRHRLVPLATAACCLMLAAGPALSILTEYVAVDSRVTVLDVGEGSSVVLQLPGGETILIDCGTRARDYDVGERLTAPFLWLNRIRRIDQVVISHPHADHYNGLAFLLDRFRPHTLWVNGRPSPHFNYNRLLAQAGKLAMNVRVPRAGEVLYKEGETTVTNLADLHQTVAEADNEKKRGTASINNQSLVLRLQHGNTAFLFPGDIDQQTETYLLSTGIRVVANVLLAGHHDAATSNSAAFLEATSPEFFIVSGSSKKKRKEDSPGQVGGNSRYTLYSTRRHGTVTFSTDGQAVSVSPFLP